MKLAGVGGICITFVTTFVTKVICDLTACKYVHYFRFLLVLRTGHESDEFLELFENGIRIMAGGVASGFNHVEPDLYTTRLLRVKVRVLHWESVLHEECTFWFHSAFASDRTRLVHSSTHQVCAVEDAWEEDSSKDSLSRDALRERPKWSAMKERCGKNSVTQPIPNKIKHPRRKGEKAFENGPESNSRTFGALILKNGGKGYNGWWVTG